MDHPYPAPTPFTPLPPEVTATGARIVAFLHSGGRAVVLVGAPRTGKTSTLDAVLAGMPAWVERVANPGRQPLTLPCILAQVGAPAGEDAGLALVRTLAERAGNGAPAVLSVDDAHTLTPEALSALARLPGLDGPEVPKMMLLLSGSPALLKRLGAPDLAPLRAGRTLTLRMPAPGSLAQGSGVLGAGGATSGERGSGRRWPLVLAVLGLAALSGGLLLRAPQPAPAVTMTALAASVPLPAAAADGAAPASPRADERRSAVPPVPQAPVTPPGADGAGPSVLPAAQVRRDFEAFLDRAGRDTARLGPAAREGLFREYVKWRAQAGL